MIGRSNDLGLLRQLCRSAGAGAGGAALVDGLPGAGKTSLLRALVDEAPELRAFWGRSPQEGGAPAYWPWREIASTAGWHDLDWTGASDQWSLWARVAETVTAAARDHPLLLLVDDLHAAEGDTVRMTAYLASVLRDAPVALVVAARPDERLAALARACTTTLSLAPLDDAESDKVIDLHARTALNAESRAVIRGVAEGNPLVLRELARGAGDGRLPREVRVTVEQRLAPLDQQTRTMVNAAAVLGRAFDLATLAGLIDLPPAEVLALLGPLRDHGILVGEGPRWSFSHQVVRDSVYEALPEEVRLDTHRKAALALDPQLGPASVAEHLLAAVPLVPSAQAVAAAREAAAEAARVSAYADRASLLARALPLVPDGPTRLDVLLDLGEALLAAGSVGAAAETFDEALTIAGQLGDEPARARALLGRCALVESTWAITEHLPALADAARAVEVLGADAWLVRLLARRATLQIGSGQPRAGLADAQRAVAVARALDDPQLLGTALSALHMCCWAPERLDLALAIADDLVVAADTSGDLDLMLEAAVASMVDALRTGDLAALDHALDRAAAIADRSGSPRHLFFVLTRRAMRALVVGRLSEAASLLRRAEEIGATIEEPDAIQVVWGAQFLVLAELQPREDLVAFANFLESWIEQEPRVAAVAANFLAAAGDLDGARRLLVIAIAAMDGKLEAPRQSDPAWLVVMALSAVAIGDQELAEQVAALIEPYGGLLIVNAGAVTFCGAADHWLGLLAGVRGRASEARTLLEGAVAAYRAMGATWFERSASSALEGMSAAPVHSAPAERRAMMRRTDDGWQIGWIDQAAQLPDVRGLHHLHALLSSPGREIHSADLVRPGASALVDSTAKDALLDDTAKAAYRRRVQHLQEVIADAETDGDTARASESQAELDVLLDELRRAVGLGGRDRPLADDAERARVAVRKAVTSAVTRLAEHDATLAAHLRTSVRTGLFCSYQPDPTAAVSWTLA